MNQRDRIKQLRESLHPGRAISEAQWLQLVSLLDTIVEGYDVRDQLGIKPKSGKPPNARSLRQWIAVHFEALKCDEPDTDDKVHRGTVAQAWGITDNSVRKLAAEHGEKARAVLAGAGIEAVFQSVPILQAEYRRVTRKSRQLRGAQSRT